MENFMKKNVIIIGAGPAGLTAAYELLKDNSEEYNVIILEETNEIGGISKTVNYKNNRIDIGTPLKRIRPYFFKSFFKNYTF